MTVFSGIMTSPKVDEEALEVEVVSPLYNLEKQVPRRIYQNFCQWTFDSPECRGGGASLADEKTGTADAGSTATVLKDSDRTEVDDYWKDGQLEMTSGENSGEVRQILSSTSGEITLLFAFPHAIAKGDTYKIRRGCDKSIKSCRDKFHNEINFGGFVTVPGRE